MGVHTHETRKVMQGIFFLTLYKTQESNNEEIDKFDCIKDF